MYTKVDLYLLLIMLLCIKKCVHGKSIINEMPGSDVLRTFFAHKQHPKIMQRDEGDNQMDPRAVGGRRDFSEDGINIEEKGRIDEFGLYGSYKNYAKDQSTIDSVNELTFQQIFNDFRDSVVANTILDFELYFEGLRRRAQPPGTHNANNEMMRDESFKLRAGDKKFNRFRSSIERKAGSNLISFNTNFSIGDHGHAGDVTNLATGSGSLTTSNQNVDNQGHNFISNSDVSQISALAVSSSS